MKTALAALPLTLAIAAWVPATAHEIHAHGHAQSKAEGEPYSRGPATVVIPAVTLQRADGKRVRLQADLDDGRPLLVNFVYTTCTAICPTMTRTFAEFQQRLGAEAAQVRMASVSIDPEQDTPERLAAYAKQFGAGAQWTFYTGTNEASVAVQKGFGAWRLDKMSHTPATWLRAAPGKPWLRLDGFTTSAELVQEYRRLIASR